MSISARVCQLADIADLREEYRQEMACQIIHDSIHPRPGWTVEYLLEMEGSPVGYGSVVIGGPWKSSPTIYEFHLKTDRRRHAFQLFEALLTECQVRIIETQTNAILLPIMLHTFAKSVQAEAILFEDRFETHLAPEGANFRPRKEEDVETLKAYELDDTAGWVVTLEDKVVGAGGVLYHYNRPYGDVYMKIAELFQGRGLGAFLVQELKRACREGGSIPGARCNVGNVASRRTLQKAGFVPCGNMVSGDLNR